LISSNKKHDFTTFTEVDPGTDIAVAADKLTVTTLVESREAFVYYDFGSAYFDTDFEHKISFKHTAGGYNVWLGVWGLSNDIDSIVGLDTAGDKRCVSVAIRGASPTYYVYLSEIYDGTGYSDYCNTVSLNTDYYLTISFDRSAGSNGGGVITCYIYSDSDRTAPVDTLTLDLHAWDDYRYLFALQAYTEAGADTISAEISDLYANLKYPKFRSGIQLNTPHTTPSYVLTQNYNAGLTASKVYQNKGTIPAASDFDATAVHTDASDASLGRFSKYPDFTAAYCNEQEACIWAGDETRIGAFLTVTAIAGLAVTNPIDFTVELTNTLQSTGNILSFTTKKALIASTRPLKGIKFYVKTANGTASTSTVKYWNGSDWAAVSGFDDGTRPGTKSLAQTGTMSFDSTVAVAKVACIEGMVLYFYLVELSAGSATLYHVTNDAPFQPILDIWDGIYRTCITLQASRSSGYEDYTIEINTPSSQMYPIQALLGGLTSSDFVIAIFEERMTALNVAMIAGMTNIVAATVTINYWNGTGWATVGTVTDGTLATGASMNQSGVMSWNAPAETSEKPQTLFGVTGYAYQIKWSATLTDRARDSTGSHHTDASGSHTGGDDEAVLTDASKSWATDEWVGYTINNTTDGSSATVTANTAITITGTLAGGTDNDWDTDDTYTIDADSVAVLTDASKSWATDEWVGSIIHNTTDGSSATVTANTAITITGTLAGGTDNDWDGGDTYIIDPWEENHDGTSLDMLFGIPAQKTIRPFRFPFMFQNRPML